MTRRAVLALGAGLSLGLLLALLSMRWPMGDATGIVLLSAGSGLVAAVLIGVVIEMVLHPLRVSRSPGESRLTDGSGRGSV
jgi:xanthosine utilization system XapX-like protein